MDHFPPTLNKLTKNQKLVMAELSDVKGPLSAYTILDQLREQGLRAPLQVYRALDKLVELGMVHKLESQNAFVACRQTESSISKTVVFTICDNCGDVSEIEDGFLDKHLNSLMSKASFNLRGAAVELFGICDSCS
jgi:Fur family zinc uptake transcriptional regulator